MTNEPAVNADDELAKPITADDVRDAFQALMPNAHIELDGAYSNMTKLEIHVPQGNSLPLIFSRAIEAMRKRGDIGKSQRVDADGLDITINILDSKLPLLHAAIQQARQVEKKLDLHGFDKKGHLGHAVNRGDFGRAG